MTKTITISHRIYSHLKLEWLWTDDRQRRFEVFAPDGYVFMPDDVSSFVCIDCKDAIERVQASELIPVQSKSVAENNAQIICTRCGGHCNGPFSCDANLARKAARS